MSDDFQKGTRGDDRDVSNFSEYHRGAAYQAEANAPRTWGSPHSSGLSFGQSGGGMVITGEHWLLQGIVSIPFIVAGALLYPVTAAASLVAGLLCDRLVPLFGPTATWERYLAYIPMLVVFWITMRWDQRMGERHAGYRRIRHVARLLVFALLGYVVTGAMAKGTMPQLLGALAGAGLGHLFLEHGDGWRDFWHRTLTNFRLRPTR